MQSPDCGSSAIGADCLKPKFAHDPSLFGEKDPTSRIGGTSSPECLDSTVLVRVALALKAACTNPIPVSARRLWWTQYYPERLRLGIILRAVQFHDPDHGRDRRVKIWMNQSSSVWRTRRSIRRNSGRPAHPRGNDRNAGGLRLGLDDSLLSCIIVAWDDFHSARRYCEFCSGASRAFSPQSFRSVRRRYDSAGLFATEGGGDASCPLDRSCCVMCRLCAPLMRLVTRSAEAFTRRVRLVLRRKDCRCAIRGVPAARYSGTQFAIDPVEPRNVQRPMDPSSLKKNRETSNCNPKEWKALEGKTSRSSISDRSLC